MKPNQRAHERRRPGRRAKIAGEGGFLLVMVMVVMLIVSAIAASTLINSFLEKSLAKNQNYASIALQAADAGISVGQAWVHESMNGIYNPMSDNDFYTNPAKYDWSFTIDSTAANGHPVPGGGAFVVTMRFKREWRDYNGDGDCADPGEISQYSDYDDPFPAGPTFPCLSSWPDANSGEIVIYNKTGSATTPLDKRFGFPASRAIGTPGSGKEGYPVIEITSVGTYGNASYRQVILDVARNIISVPGLRGAISAAGGVGFGHSMAQKKDGRTHKLDGTLGYENPICAGPLGDQQPDVMVDFGKPVVDPKASDTNVNDGAATVNNPVPYVPLPGTSWAAMGFDSQAEMEADANVVTFTIPSPPASAATVTAAAIAAIQPGVIVYVRKQNPADPDFTIQPGAKQGVLVLDGTFYQRGGGDFTGLVVAKGVDVNGNSQTLGAIVTWDADTPAVWGNGTIDILYSCDALVQGMGNSGWESRLAWNRVR